jgi:hypothetical protein
MICIQVCGETLSGRRVRRNRKLGDAVGVREARLIKWGVVAVLVATVLLTVVAVHSAKPAAGGVKAAAVARGAAPASAVAVKPNRIPFTGLDLVLLGTGGAMLLLLGSAIRRVRDERSGG